jgi:hypothetical protein
MGTVRRRRPQSSQARVHLAVGLLAGGLLGATAGLVAGVRQYIESNAVITEPSAHLHGDQPQLSSGGGADPADDDCASDPRVTLPLVGMVAGIIFGISAAQAYDQMLRFFRESGSRRLKRRTSKVTGR